MKTDELREQYLAFFESKGCVRRPSDVLVPTWDKSVLFTPAGMNQFKDHFLGKCKLEFTKATTCQKCLRTVDIDNVGKTAYHHTFFEMLGNFSFGDYFKKEAIVWAWEFLTSPKWLKLDPAKLSVTVYKDDDEAAGIWHDIVGLPTNKITRCEEDENFWPASAPTLGPDGVCGPCSEIYYQSGPNKCVEIWNLVFTQFNRVGPPPNNLEPLPSRNIDTGMGLERTASALQGVDTNFHIDTLLPLVKASAEVCKQTYQAEAPTGRRLRRIADHVRACTFAIHENVMPGANGAPYVIRRLLRRAVLDGHDLGLREPFLHMLVNKVAEVMRHPYPELSETTARVADVILQEETRFLANVDTGMERINKLFKDLERKSSSLVPGEQAAELYTTHGFPPELLEAIAAEKNLKLDWDAYKKSMDKHAKESGGGKKPELFGSSPLDALKKTQHATEFLGYEHLSSESTIVGILAQNELCERVTEIGHASPITVVLDRSPFYGEAGGQVGDQGELTSAGLLFDVTDTQRDGDLILHLGHLKKGSLKLGQSVTASVQTERRQAICRAHTATHLLHAALQQHLGKFAQQQGSKVSDDWLRFDFTSPKAVPAETLSAIEQSVNAFVMAAAQVGWKRMPLADARQTGAMMLFGERYPDVVRVVKMGEISQELCGGTHLDNTGQVGLFRIVAEESVAAGTRRIEAVTGAGALKHLQTRDGYLQELTELLKTSAADLPKRVGTLVQELRDLKKKLATQSASTAVSADDLLGRATSIGPAQVIVEEVAGGNTGSLRQNIDQLRQKQDRLAVLLATKEGDKVTLIAGISKSLQDQGLDASKWLRAAVSVVGGKGGGRADMAQAGGLAAADLPKVMDAARAEIPNLLASLAK